jgi:two-component system NtrC family sensor kinase
MVENAPMISQLIQQLGLEIGAVLRADRDTIVDLAQKTYNVFYVADANGSPYIPAQTDFVQPHGIRSVLGFGGMLPSGNLFAVIMFAKVAISRETADLFANIALAAKLALLPFDGNATFAGFDA